MEATQIAFLTRRRVVDFAIRNPQLAGARVKLASNYESECRLFRPLFVFVQLNSRAFLNKLFAQTRFHLSLHFSFLKVSRLCERVITIVI